MFSWNFCFRFKSAPVAHFSLLTGKIFRKLTSSLEIGLHTARLSFIIIKQLTRSWYPKIIQSVKKNNQTHLDNRMGSKCTGIFHYLVVCNRTKTWCSSRYILWPVVLKCLGFLTVSCFVRKWSFHSLLRFHFPRHHHFYHCQVSYLQLHPCFLW